MKKTVLVPIVFLLLVNLVAGFSVTRSFSSMTPEDDSPLVVTLTVDADSESYYAIVEEFPLGWVVTDPGDGTLTTNGETLKWFVMPALDGTHTYTVQTPLIPGLYDFQGTFAADGTTVVNTLGDTQVSVIELDTTPPQITSLSVTPEVNNVDFSVQTDEPSSVRIEYGLTEAFGNVVFDNGFMLPHLFEAQGLDEGSLYYYQVEVCDAEDNCETSSVQTFYTLTGGEYNCDLDPNYIQGQILIDGEPAPLGLTYKIQVLDGENQGYEYQGSVDDSYVYEKDSGNFNTGDRIGFNTDSEFRLYIEDYECEEFDFFDSFGQTLDVECLDPLVIENAWHEPSAPTETDDVIIKALVDDNDDLDTAIVGYGVNGFAYPPMQMTFSDPNWVADLGKFNAGDVVVYSVIVTDLFGTPTYSDQGTFTVLVGDKDGDGFNSDEDCNDSNKLIYPGADEVCDLVDNDCDTLTDEEDATGCTMFFYDGDYDDYGSSDSKCLCSGEGFYVATTNGDCVDNNPSINPGATEICNNLDDDCDENTLDGSGVTAPLNSNQEGICHETRQACVVGVWEDYYVFTGYEATEENCDGVDNDCDGSVDEDLTTTYYFDDDEDGYGNLSVTIEACGLPTGYSENSLDCRDDLPAINPAALELCGDGLDNNCNGETDEEDALECTIFYLDGDGDLFGTDDSRCLCSPDGDYDTEATNDCVDDNPLIYPGAVEECNGVNDDCDSTTADGSGVVAPMNNIQEGVCFGSQQFCSEGDWEDYYYTIPGYEEDEESCDEIDNDCDGETDEDLTTTYYFDDDDDGYGNASITIEACGLPTGYSANSLDCRDDLPAINPSALELCGDGLDNNCNGETDEENALECITFYLDGDGDLFGTDDSRCLCSPDGDYDTEDTNDCVDDNPLIYPGAVEECNNVDDDCNENTLDGSGVTAPLNSNQEGICHETRQACVVGVWEDYYVFTGYQELETLCDEVDNDCDGETDVGLTTTYYFDDDGDGYGNLSVTIEACGLPTGYSANSLDCRDDLPAINPGALELCGDGLDNNCNGEIDEEDALECTLYYEDADHDDYGKTLEAKCLCEPEFDYDATQNGDCDDTDQNIFPGADEICNGEDDDCDKLTDEEDAFGCITFYYDGDHDGFGIDNSKCLCSADDSYTSSTSDDCVDDHPLINPEAEEICDGLDNDCDKDIDEGFPNNDGDDLADCVDPDDDNDGIKDIFDNCQFIKNFDQLNHDTDPDGDACDDDDDDDGHLDDDDNCQFIANVDQLDTDDDGIGDVCDGDIDEDGIPNIDDNCVYDKNPDQLDNDKDKKGDVCDDDDDNDGIKDDPDNCQFIANLDQLDYDDDGLGDACDPDSDNDGIFDVDDNCIIVPNPDQLDTDGDGMGDVCDPYPNDKDNDGYTTDIDCNDNDASIHPDAVEIIDDDIDQNCVNDAPVIQPIDQVIVTEGELVKVIPVITDPDGDAFTITFATPLKSNGQWQTDFTDAGIYPTSVGATDAHGATSTEEFDVVVVEFGNHKPFISPIKDITVTEGEIVIIEPVVSDLDEDELTITISMPVGDDGVWQTKEGDNGKYEVKVKAFDGIDTVTRTVKVTVRKEAFDALRVDSIMFEKKTVRPGEVFNAWVNVGNIGNRELDRTKITVTIPDLGVYATSGRFDLEESNEEMRKLEIRIPKDTEPGIYKARFTISNDRIRRVKHRDVVVV